MATEPILFDLPDAFDGPRVRVRKYEPGEGAEVFAAVRESIDHLLPWMPWVHNHQEPSDGESYVRMTRGQWELRQDMACGFWDRERGRYLGGTGLHPIDWGVPSFEIGYWIRASEAGKGYTTEAARLLTRAAFEHLGAHRVQIRVATENAASLKIPAKLKYVEEGVSRNAIRYADGALYDLVIFAMTRSRYESLWPYQ